MAVPGELRVVDDVPAAFADLVTGLAPRAVALSGGATARRCYEELAAREPDWSRVEVFFGDERFVPPEHPDSNEGLARRALLDHVEVAVVHPMYRPVPIEAAADEYDRLVPVVAADRRRAPRSRRGRAHGVALPRLTRARRA
ncbi:MAG: hypothetical protein KatS3mg010_0357 [Acidimicrobiia bacterium]|nr:MAG: hypothetical protein KatS3mg010_0357 [Acidimicrobiia bacterium]